MLSQKQTLADGVLDGQDDLKAMTLPSGRRAFVERMSAMMAPPAAPVPTALTEQGLRDELVGSVMSRAICGGARDLIC